MADVMRLSCVRIHLAHLWFCDMIPLRSAGTGIFNLARDV